MANKGLKTAGIIGCVLVVVILLLILFGDLWLSSTVDSFLRTEFSKLNTAYINYSDLDIRMGQRAIVLDDVEFCTSPDNNLHEDSTGIRLRIDKLSLRGFQFIRMLNRKEVDIRSIALKNPDIEVHLPLQRHGAPIDPADTLVKDTMRVKSALLRNIIARTISVSDGHLSVLNVNNRLRVEMENLDLKTHGIGYHFGDSSCTPEDEVLRGHMLYNDSLYTLSLQNFSFLSPNGLFRTDIDRLSTKNGGPISVQGIHAYHTCDKGDLSERMGETKVTWADIRLEEMTTTPVSLIRQAMTRNIEIDSVFLSGKKIHLLRDARHPSKKAYKMPQEQLLAMEMPILVKHVNALVPEMQVEVLTTHLENCGALELKHINLAMSNISNHEGDRIHTNAHMLFGNEGEGHMQLKMLINHASNFDFNLHATGIDGEMFNKFIHPLFGSEVHCRINDVTAACAGNRDALQGTFCMQYDSIHVHVFKEDAPYKAIAKGAGAINLFAPMIVPKSNPKHHGDEPRAYDVNIKRDHMNSFAHYLIMPVVDGSIQTLLPGFVVKSIHRKQTQKRTGKAD